MKTTLLCEVLRYLHENFVRYGDLNISNGRGRVGCPKGERVSKGNDSDKGVYLHRLQQNKRFKHKKLTLQTKYNDKSLTSNQPFVHICTYANRINNFSMVCRVIHFYVNLTASKSFKTNNRQ